MLLSHVSVDSHRSGRISFDDLEHFFLFFKKEEVEDSDDDDPENISEGEFEQAI